MQLPKIKIGQKPTYVKVAEDVDFFALFQKIEPQFETCFVFESLGEEGKFARYSIIGFDPAHIVSARGKTLTYDGKKYVVENPYYALRDILPPETIARNYSGGLIGYMSYEAVNYMESVDVKVHKDFDQFLFGVYLDGLVFDKLTNELFYFFFEVDRSAMLKTILKEPVRSGEISR
jgi:anthranilate synthase component 1